ncbi:uncharacterized protein LOC120003327 isoform X2 [Tripterygium wilfordii]|uniref:uncharacterized protein LOC120003327 isoform X2 n=1 Tax=Tripterygium wilfordii TaxID=458696 RepID=UPI0018F7F38A|nr:uncharacterized protein LOC120003327 isoform X2 [Tripterygium wilfordii]
MEREREARNNLFNMGEPFPKFQGFGGFGSLFGGRDPFDDPFFTCPQMDPFFTHPLGSMFQSGVFGPRTASGDVVQTDGGKGLVIEELDSDDEGGIDKGIGAQAEQYNNQKQAGSSNEPSVEHPDDDADENRSKNMSHRNFYNKVEGTQPQTRSFSASSSKVTYGGVDGAYYTSTRTRRMDTDGAVVEESKEADRTTGQATHRISRGIDDKGHSVTRKLTSDGNVDVMQTLHNLNEDELAGFEQAWKGKGQIQSWSEGFGKNGGAGSGSKQEGNPTKGGWALPSIGHAGNAGGIRSANPSAGRTRKVVRINIE